MTYEVGESVGTSCRAVRSASSQLSGGCPMILGRADILIKSDQFCERNVSMRFQNWRYSGGTASDVE